MKISVIIKLFIALILFIGLEVFLLAKLNAPLLPIFKKNLKDVKVNNNQVNVNTPGSISINNQIQDIDISFADLNKLQNILENSGYWKENFVSNYNNIASKFTARSIEITFFPLDNSTGLTDDAFFVQKDNDNNSLISSYSKFDEEKIHHIKIGVSSIILKGNNPAKWLDYAFWNSIYMVLDYKPMTEGGIDHKAQETFINSHRAQINVFSINKK